MKKKYNAQIKNTLIALFSGVLLSVIKLPFIREISLVFSNLFLKFLQLLSLPMIFLAVTSTLSGLKNLDSAKILGKKVLFYTVLTTVIASSLSLSLYLIVAPNDNSTTLSVINADKTTAIVSRGYLDFLIELFPHNVITAFSENNVIGIVIIGFALGLASLLIPHEQREDLNRMFNSLFSVTLKIAHLITKIMPLAVFAFVVTLTYDITNDDFSFKNLIKYLICILSATLIQGLVVLPILLKIKKFSPLILARKLLPVLSMAFFSKSSNATLPLTMDVMENENNITPEISRFSLPLCSVINMNGCAAFILITTIFVGIESGLTFSLYRMLGMIVIASLAAIGNAGIPMGCFFLTGSLLLNLGSPSIGAMGYILPLYSFIDMVETALNVWSDCVITSVVNKEMNVKKISIHPHN